MTTQTFDPAQYKMAQLKGWDSVAAGWQEWWEAIEQGAHVLSDRLVEISEINSVQRVLAVATGRGEPAVTAARRVGPTGRVVATDQAPQMLAIARDRAAKLGLHNLDFVESDAETLDLPEASFDAVLSRWGLMYFPNLIATLERLRLLLKPGGHLAAVVWNTPDKALFASLAMGVIGKELQAPPPAPGTPGPFTLADPKVLEGRLSEAGFKAVRSEKISFTTNFAKAEDFTHFTQAVSSPARAMLANQSEERKAEIWDKVTQETRKYTTADGTIQIVSECFCVVGQR